MYTGKNSWRKSETARSGKIFGKKYGYENTEPEQCLALLKKRFEAAEAFPHEIGIFLDYPLGDVIGFIQNSGQNYKCSGCWKVYCNECEALKMFQKYHKCREVTGIYGQKAGVFCS